MNDFKKQEDLFNTAYKKYTEYKNFIELKSVEIKKERESFQEYAKNNVNKRKELVEKLFDINEKPMHFQADLSILQERLLYVFKSYEDLLEIPEEVKKEINSFKTKPLIYKIKKGKAIEIDKEYNNKLRKITKETYNNYLEALIEK